MSRKGLEGVWSDVQRLSLIRLLVVDKLSEDVGDHLSAQREVLELMLLLLLLRHEKRQPVVSDDRVVFAITAVKQTQTVRGGRSRNAIKSVNIDLPESVYESFREISSQSR